MGGSKWPPYPLSEGLPSVHSIRDVMNTIKEIEYSDFTNLKSPKETADSKKGSCHDQSMLEYDMLEQLGLKPKIKFFIEANQNGQGGTTHSLVYFKKDKQIFWIENAWNGNQGLHEYSSYKNMMTDIIRKWPKNDQYANLFYGNIDRSKMITGMKLQDLVNIVDFDN